MGRGIVQLFAAAGYRVRCVDAVPGAALQAADHVGRALRRSADKGKLTHAEVDAISSRIHACDALSQIAGCEIVIEAIVEDLTVKIGLFRQLEEMMPICSYCKKIRDDRGIWNRIETYISQHSDASFTHGLCPDCAVKTMKQGGIKIPKGFLKKYRKPAST